MEYHVSPEGDDGSPGSESQPFRTLGRAAAALAPDDTCWVGGGTYREVLRPPRSGEPGRPIAFRARPGEAPLIVTMEPVTDWRPEGGGLWSAAPEADLDDGNQLFAGSTPLPEARWPRDSRDPFHPTRAAASAGTASTLTDPALSGETGAWTGATLWCAGGHRWICWGGVVTAYDAASHTLTFDSPTAATHWYTPREGSEYVLIGARAALDEPGSWCVDGADRRLWMVALDGRPPAAWGVESRARRTAIDLCGREHIHLSGLHFCGGGLRTDGASRALRLEGLRGEWVAHSWRRDASDEGVVLDGEDHVVRGCDFGFSSGSVVRLRGRHHKLLGNHVHHGNYGGLWSGTLSVAGRRHVIAHNTVRHSGRDLVSVHGLMESLVEHNDLSHAGWLTQDLGITYGHDTDFAGTLIRRNWVHDCVSAGLAEGIYFDHCSHNAVVCQNLIWNIPGMPIQVNNPGHFNLIAHNSCYRTGTHRPEITSFDHSHRQDLFGCRFVNNLVNGPFRLPDNARAEDNLVSADPGYADGEAGNLSLRADSPARGAGRGIVGVHHGDHCDLGAVPYGETPWLAGWDSGLPLDESAEWFRPNWAGTNRLVNAAFELGSLEGWRATGDGASRIVPGNGWGNKVSGTEEAPTGTSRHELELIGPAAVEQEVEGLPTGTRVSLSAWVRAGGDRARVVLEVCGAGGPLGHVASDDAAWQRLCVNFTSGPIAEPVTVRVRHVAAASTGAARVDNLGLVEAD